MTVRELITKLTQCDPDAKVEIEGYSCRTSDITLESTFYSRPDNKWVVFKSGASDKPEEIKNLEEKLEEIKTIMKAWLEEEI